MKLPTIWECSQEALVSLTITRGIWYSAHICSAPMPTVCTYYSECYDNFLFAPFKFSAIKGLYLHDSCISLHNCPQDLAECVSFTGLLIKDIDFWYTFMVIQKLHTLINHIKLQMQTFLPLVKEFWSIKLCGGWQDGSGIKSTCHNSLVIWIQSLGPT